MKDDNVKRRLFVAVGYSDEEILQTVQDQLNDIVSRVRYRRVYRALVHKVWVVRKHVWLLIKELDPEAVILREWQRLCRHKYSTVGPGFTWHVDGYDKLKYYAFSIHWSIDGFSRKILWLRLGASNKDANATAKLYFDMVSEFSRVG